MKRETCRLLTGIIVVLMSFTPIISITLALVVSPKCILIIFIEILWIILVTEIVEYATNRYGGNW